MLLWEQGSLLALFTVQFLIACSIQNESNTSGEERSVENSNAKGRDQYHSILWYTMVYCGILWYTVVYYGVLWYTMVYCGILWCTVVYCGVLWCTVVYCGVLWYTVVKKGCTSCECVSKVIPYLLCITNFVDNLLCKLNSICYRIHACTGTCTCLGLFPANTLPASWHVLCLVQLN